MDNGTQPIVKVHWRKPVQNPNYTTQEKLFIDWLGEQKIPFSYEQLEFVKEEKQKTNRKRLLHKVLDFAFKLSSNTTFAIELTDRKRPNLQRAQPRKYDPKRETRHLARLASIECAVIYRDELEIFTRLYSSLKADQQNQVEKLLQTLQHWNKIEWTSEVATTE